MSELRVAELEDGRRFGELSSKKTICSRFSMLLLRIPVLLAIKTGSYARGASSTVSGTGVLRSSYPFVPTGIGAMNLWKVNKNHRFGVVVCRYSHLGQKQNIDTNGQRAFESLPQLWLKRTDFARLNYLLFILNKSGDIPPTVWCA